MTTPVSHVDHPASINQFFKIVIASNGVPKKGARWANVVNGHDYDAENCMAAEGAVAASAQRDLKAVYSPNRIRAAQTDFVGGIGVDDVDDAFHVLGIGSLTRPAGCSFDDVLHNVAQRRHAALAVDYRKMAAGAKLQLPGNFDHALGLDDVDEHLGLILVYDSLGLAPTWRKISDVRPAAEALAIRERGDKGALFVGFTKVRAALAVGHYIVHVRILPSDHGELHPFGVYTIRDGIVAATRIAHTGGFTATCTPPAIYRWPGHTSQRLVRLTSGSRRGQYIRSAYAEAIA